MAETNFAEQQGRPMTIAAALAILTHVHLRDNLGDDWAVDVCATPYGWNYGNADYRNAWDAVRRAVLVSRDPEAQSWATALNKLARLHARVGGTRASQEYMDAWSTVANALFDIDLRVKRETDNDKNLQRADVVVAIISGEVVVLKNRDESLDDVAAAMGRLRMAALPHPPTFAAELADLVLMYGVDRLRKDDKGVLLRFLMTNLVDLVTAKPDRDTSGRRESARAAPQPDGGLRLDVERFLHGSTSAILPTERFALHGGLVEGSGGGGGPPDRMRHAPAANPHIVLTSKAEIAAGGGQHGPGPDSFYRYDLVAGRITDRPAKPSPELEAMAKAAFEAVVTRGLGLLPEMPPMKWEAESEELRQDWRDNITAAMLKLKEVWGPHAADPLAMHATPVVDRVLR